MSNRVYDTLKWIALVALPAVTALVVTIGSIWGLPTDQIVATIAAIDTFIGTIIGISGIKYKNANKIEAEDEDVEINPSEDK